MPVISDQCMGVGMVSAMKRWLRVLCFEGRALSAAALFGGLLLGSAAPEPLNFKRQPRNQWVLIVRD